MGVYVDKQRSRYRGMIMCHMMADTLDELHSMADAIGVSRRHFQEHSTPHYDICLAKRRLAIRSGAIEIGRLETVKLIREWRERKNAGEG